MSNFKFLKDLISFMREAGLVYGPSPELYGGLAGFYAYGPLGKGIKEAIEHELRRYFKQHSFWEIEMPTIMPEIVWKASGHVDNFTDPVVKCKKCNAFFRVDHLLEEQLGIEEHSVENIKKYLDQLKCPNCGSKFDDVFTVSLMLKTTIGIDTIAYARPETATTTYLPFLNYYHFFRRKLPFGVFQIGKAYRNEISPRQHLLRCREFTQAEAQLFLFKTQKSEFQSYLDEFNFKLNLIAKDGKEYKLTIKEALDKGLLENSAYAYAIALAYNFFIRMGISDQRLRIRQHKDDEKAFYALDAWDIEINLNSFSWTEVCGVHDRGDYDLKQHSKFSNTDLSVRNDASGKNEIPHIIEIAFGVDRIFFSVLDQAYEKLEKEEGKTTLRINKRIAPIHVAIFPLIKKESLVNYALKLKKDLSGEFIVYYDDSGAIGRRYLRANKMGIPYAITIDFQTLDDNTITIRDRDTEKQIRVKCNNLKPILHDLLTKSNINDYSKYFIN